MRPTGALVSRTEELAHRPLVYSCVSSSVNAHVCAYGGSPPVLVLREFPPHSWVFVWFWKQGLSHWLGTCGLD